VRGDSVSAGIISRVTDVGVGEIAAWQSRPVDTVYPGFSFGSAQNVSWRTGVGSAAESLSGDTSPRIGPGSR
jgi:transposase-like protein